MRRFLVPLTLVAILCATGETFAAGAVRRSAPMPLAVAGVPIPHMPVSEMLAGCGRGRYRDPTTHNCHGPADVGFSPSDVSH